MEEEKKIKLEATENEEDHDKKGSDSTDAVKTDVTKDVKEEPAEEPKIPFSCSLCKLITVSCDYFGRKPPFARRLQITEDSYVMKDPFCPPPTTGRPNPEYFLIVGVHCAACDVQVCKSPECSFHYGKSFCSNCALENIKQFPQDIQSKVRKQLSKGGS